MTTAKLSLVANDLRDLLDGWVGSALQTAEIMGDQFPYYFSPEAKSWTPGGGWTDGFWPGILWRLYAHGNAARLRDLARHYTRLLVEQKAALSDHDLGFLYLLSCVLEHSMTGNEAVLPPALDAARRLAARYNPRGRFIRAHGTLDDPDRAGYTIIDTMMNLPLLFWAFDQTGERRFYDVALATAQTVALENVRTDGSSYQVVWFDADTGAVERKGTLQGYSTESCWARGQAWGIYGFATAYRVTGEAAFLDTATAMATFFVTHLPPDDVAPYDFGHPSPNDAPKDTSAQAIAAAGLLRLAELAVGRQRRHWLRSAERLLKGLLPYIVRGPAGRGFLRGGCDFLALGRGVNADLIYGDYYLLEAVQRYLALQVT